jgi:adenosylmethionine-8-amino-7-oxononanoate aminotransferase
MYFNQDIYCRVTMDTLIVSPPLIVTEAQIDEITDKLRKTIRKVA